MKANRVKTVTLSVAAYYDHLAWLRFMGAHAEASAVQELATLFVPPLQIDGKRVERLIRQRRNAQQQEEAAAPFLPLMNGLALLDQDTIDKVAAVLAKVEQGRTRHARTSDS